MKLVPVTMSLCSAALNQTEIVLRIGSTDVRFDAIDQLLLPDTNDTRSIVNEFRKAHQSVDDTLCFHDEPFIEVRNREDNVQDDSGYRYQFESDAVTMIRTTYCDE